MLFEKHIIIDQCALLVLKNLYLGQWQSACPITWILTTEPAAKRAPVSLNIQYYNSITTVLPMGCIDLWSVAICRMYLALQVLPGLFIAF